MGTAPVGEQSKIEPGRYVGHWLGIQIVTTQAGRLIANNLNCRSVATFSYPSTIRGDHRDHLSADAVRDLGQPRKVVARGPRGTAIPAGLAISAPPASSD